LEQTIQNSLCFGLYERVSEEKENQSSLKQIGFSRVITDYSTYAYLCDVYVLEQYRGQGLGKWLMSSVMRHPELQNLRRFQLITRDAHEFYRSFGFTDVSEPEHHMEISNDEIYQKVNS
ncbi:MAG: GNAT family N-acetyltransferase, partial [Pyrinomonadaceae bacterium]